MSSDIAIKVESLSKCYQIYSTPRDRLKQFTLPRLQRLLGRTAKHYFREFRALQDISFEIRKGETVGIIGKNGSGKSTLLQMICGTLNPTSGNIETQGRIAALLELGSGFNPDFTGRENVYMNASVLGLSSEDTDARFDEIAAFADIGDFIDQPVKTYSSGMQMRLAFAVSVCVDPEILVVDEALAVGDMVFQQKCFQRLADLKERGTTILMVSHDIMLIRNYCGRAIYLSAGSLKRDGDAETVGEAYVQDMFAERQGSISERDTLEWREGDNKGKLAFGSKRGRVTKVRMRGEQSTGSVFQQGEMVSIDIYGEIAPDVINPEFVFQLRDGRGYVLYGIPTSPDVLQVVEDADHKKVTARLDVALSLGAGIYSITMAVLDRQGQEVFTVLDKVVGIADFSIAESNTRSHGCINLYGTWQKDCGGR